MGRKTKPLGIARPMPPDGLGLAESDFLAFAPAHNVAEWVQAEILSEGGRLHNKEHKHLVDCDLVFLWASGGFNRQGRTVIGQAEEVTFRCGPWQKGRQEQQMREWFGRVPDYLITLDGGYCLACNDAAFCALVEHELYHVGHKRDRFGAPAFTEDGRPKLFIRGHDVEEFVGVVRRYGVGDPGGAIAQLAAAARGQPEVSRVDIVGACGTCHLKAA
jgi:hypothetical protein